MLPKEGFAVTTIIASNMRIPKKLQLYSYLALLCFFPENMHYMLSDFYWLNMNQQSHICFQYSRKLLTVFFFFFFNQKKAQTQVLAGSARELFKLPFWGILPSFSVYTAFLFMPFTPPEPPRRGGSGEGEVN